MIKLDRYSRHLIISMSNTSNTLQHPFYCSIHQYCCYHHSIDQP